MKQTYKTVAAAIFISCHSLCLATSEDEAYVERNGGWCQVRGKGCIAVIDCRDTPRTNDYYSGIIIIQDSFNVVFTSLVSKGFTIKTATERAANSGGNVTIFIIEDPDFPLALTAREEKWTVVNVAKLKQDKPSQSTLERRIGIIFSRECCRVLGCDEFNSTDTLFNAIRCVNDIDLITSSNITLNASMSMQSVMPKLGIEPIEMGTYRDACMEGSAPAPTNQIQRQVWDEVHAPPKTPLKIKFDPATQKGKVTK